jgi:hypothetical protein
MTTANKFDLSPQVTKISFQNEEMEEKYRGEAHSNQNVNQRVQATANNMKLQGKTIIKFYAG